ncbi:MAG: hypothetical protein E4H14_19235, partial [Candidatus Thorarchaeota archaeon]
MDRSILGCTVLLFLMIAFSSGISIIPSGGPESAGEPNNGQQMALADSYTPHGSINITSNADFFNQGWPGNGTLANPYIIEGLNITADAVCISITDTTVYFEVRNCLISSESESFYDGIVLDNVTHGTARNCTIDRHHFGISITESINCTLINNIAFSNSWYGFFMNSSDYCALTNNTSTSNYYGFSLSYSDNCTLMNNTATSNYDMGFIMGFSNCSTLTNNTAISNNWGFDLYSFNYGTLTNNTAFDNDAGFVLQLSNNCNLTYNTATSNGGGGVFLGSGSDYNILYLNRFGNNGGSNAQDSGASNLWDDSVSYGNYWMDYNGIGIYLIPGSAGSVDNYPLVWDIVIPSVDNPADVEYIEGESGNSITWSPSDDHPKNYTIYRNDTVIVSESWNGSSITVEVDGLSYGLYNYTLVVTDMVGQTAIDEVLVTVVDGTIPAIDSPADFQYDEFSTGHSITWHPSDLHPQSYVIYMDGSPVKSGVWNSSSESITVSVDGLDIGVYKYTLLVADIVGYGTSDEVLVTVVDGTAPIMDNPADFQYDEFSTGHSITWHPSDLHPQSYV